MIVVVHFQLYKNKGAFISCHVRLLPREQGIEGQCISYINSQLLVMERFSGGMVKAALHRVVPPPGKADYRNQIQCGIPL